MAAAGLALQLVVFAFLAYLNPFGLIEASDEESEDIVRQVLAPFHPAAGDQHVTVVLFTDTDLRDWGQAWPVSYARQAELLTALLRLGAHAVFYDLAFTHRHGSAEELAQFRNALAHAKRREVPVTVAGFGKGAYRDVHGTPTHVDGVLAEIAEASAGVATVHWSGFGRYYPLRVAPCADEVGLPDAARHEECQGLLDASACEPGGVGEASPPCTDNTHVRVCADGAGASGGGSGPRCEMVPLRPTPATLLHHHWCERNGGGCRLTLPDGDVGPPMLPVWSSRLPLGYLDLLPAMATECAAHRDGTPALDAIALAYHGLMATDRPARPCFFPATLEARMVLAWSRDEKMQPLLKRLIAGRTVIVGARLDGIPDVDLSPVHGQVPGVLVHAAALDNLLSLGDGFLRAAPDIAGAAGWDDLIEALLLIVLLVKAKQVERARAGSPRLFAVLSRLEPYLPGAMTGVSLLLVLQLLVQGQGGVPLGTALLTVLLLLHALASPRLDWLSRKMAGCRRVKGPLATLAGYAALILVALAVTPLALLVVPGSQIGPAATAVTAAILVGAVYWGGRPVPPTDGSAKRSGRNQHWIGPSALAQTLLLSGLVICVYTAGWRFAPVNWLAIGLLGFALLPIIEEIRAQFSLFSRCRPKRGGTATANVQGEK